MVRISNLPVNLYLKNRLYLVLQCKHPTKYILFLHLARPYFANKNLCKKMTMYVSKCLA